MDTAKNVESKCESNDELKCKDSNETTPTTTTMATKRSDQIINLNVGGKKFTTSRSTMTNVPNNFFESKFSGRFGDIGSEEEVFIDRDGKNFSHILNFLRCKGAVVSLPKDEASKQQLLVEAQFYSLTGLIRAILQPDIDLNEHLPTCVARMQETEANMRKQIVQQTSNSFNNSQNPRSGLISLFNEQRDNDNNMYLAGNYFGVDLGDTPRNNCLIPLRYIHENVFRQKCEKNLYLDYTGVMGKKKDNYIVTVESFDAFLSNCAGYSGKVFSRLKTLCERGHLVIAGGSVLKALTVNDDFDYDIRRNFPSNHVYWNRSEFWTSSTRTSNGDIDLFMYGLTPARATEKVREILEEIAVVGETWVMVRAEGVINIHNDYSKIQIVLRLYDTMTEILLGFDVDCCCCCYDGFGVYVLPRFISSVMTGVNVLNSIHSWPKKASYELRLAKYAHRGFTVYVPGMAKDRPNLYNDRMMNSKLHELFGVSRFLKIVIEMDPAQGLELRNTHAFFKNYRGRKAVRPRSPREIPNLRPIFLKETMDDSQLLIEGLTGSYDEINRDVLVPNIYILPGHRGPMQWQWFDVNVSFDPLTNETRTKAINMIVDGTDGDRTRRRILPDGGIAYRLYDAWVTKKLSREYLNDQMHKVDVDTVYYSSLCNNDAVQESDSDSTHSSSSRSAGW